VQRFVDYLSNPSTRSALFGDTVDHVLLTAVPVSAAVVIGLVLGILAHRNVWLRPVILNSASTALTIPSLALFALLIVFVGLGFAPAAIGLTIYALLPIVRNTVSGLNSVDRATIEAAQGMGMGAGRRLVRIELPIAWPVILAGVRVATLLVVGIAAVAALVGGPGLGNPIFSGIRRTPSAGSLEDLLAGTLGIIVVAIVFDLFYLLVSRLTIPRGLQ
jgi:osmoprotectant transport system permease protein